MKITEKVHVVRYNQQKNKRFILISLIAFGVILLISIIFFFSLYRFSSDQKCDPSDFRSINQTNTKIINGEEAVPHSYPWIVSIQYKNYGHVCGGSIIDKRWILTAGHCVDKFQVSQGVYKVITGLHDRNIYTSSDTYSVIKAFSQFDQSFIFENDIALLKLDRDILFGKKVDKIKLSVTPSDNFIGKCLVTAGWGSISKTFDQELPEKLQQTYVRVIDDEKKCEIENTWEKNDVFCVKSSTTRPYSMTCSGDSGGPLAYFDQISESWSLEGVTSYVVAEFNNGGRIKCLYKRPGFFSKVYSKKNYIMGIIRDN